MLTFIANGNGLLKEIHKLSNKRKALDILNGNKMAVSCADVLK